jgi:transcriptional regulator with XRE-family HTH domain
VPKDRIEKLRKLKTKQGLSYEDLGHELGVHSLSVFRWLQKGVVPRSRAYMRAIDQFISKSKNQARRKRRRYLAHSSVRQNKSGIR